MAITLVSYFYLIYLILNLKKFFYCNHPKKYGQVDSVCFHVMKIRILPELDVDLN